MTYIWLLNNIEMNLAFIYIFTLVLI